MAFDLELGVKVTQYIAKYHLHYVSYLGTKFEVAVSNAFTRNYIIWPLTFTQNVAQYPLHHVT